jgi:polysaccharide export outer membrane protein
MRIALLLITGALLLGALAARAEYRLGPEDTVTVQVQRHPEFSGEFLIPPGGALTLPGVGLVTAAGQTPETLAARITTALARKLRKPEVTVTLRQARMQRVYVLGAVGKPGVYDLKPEWRVTEALAAAGGLTVEPSECSATLRHAAGTEATLDVAAALRYAADANHPLLPGDVLTVSPLRAVSVLVAGKVRQPGSYFVKRGEGAVTAIALAGGALPEAALSRVTITHADGTATTANLLGPLRDGAGAGDLPLRAGDQVLVPEAVARIAVLGYVNTPGYYTMPDGRPLTVSEALGLANGPDKKRSGLKSVALLRTAGGKEERRVINLERFFKTGDTRDNPTVQPGDILYVPETRKPDWNLVWQGLASVVGVLRLF